MQLRTLLSTVAIVAITSSIAAAQNRNQDQTNSNPPAQSQTPQANQQSTQPQQRPQPGTQSSQPSQSNARSKQGAAPSQSQNQSQSTQPSQSGAQSNQQQGTAQREQQTNQATQQGNQQQQPQPRSTQQPTQQQGARTQQPAQQQGSQQARQPSQRQGAQPAQQPSQQSNQRQGAQTRQPNSQAASNQAQGVATTSQQRTQIASAIRQQNVSPVRANFNVAVGVAVPSGVRLSVLPASIVSIVPQYRGYSYFVTGEQAVIVEPSSHRIVEVLPYGGGGRATASRAPAQRSKTQFTSEQRASIKRHAASQAMPRERMATSRERAATTATTTGSSRRYMVEERVPREVELEEFDDVVVREVPAARSYRYIRRDSDVIVVDPGDRRVIDIID